MRRLFILPFLCGFVNSCESEDHEDGEQLERGSFQNDKLKTDIKGLIDGSLSCLKEDARIIGGSEADRLTWRWIVFFERLGCGGTIIGPKTVATAGHCCQDTWNWKKIEEYRFYVGMHSKSSDANRKTYIPSQYIIHPLYNKKQFLEYDICLVMTNGRIEYNDQVTPACLPSINATPDPGTICFTAGWGVSDLDTAERAENLQEVDVNIIDYETCSANYGVEENKNYFLIYEEIMICAGLEEGGKDACVGDSGGPLICIDNGKPVLYGITSWGKGCAQEGSPGVYVRTAGVVDWIKEQMEEKKESDECGIKSIPSYSGLSGASHWECTGGVVNTCALKCDHDGFIPMKVECNINGQLKWSTPSKSQLKLGNCDRCSEDLSVNYPITGDGKWICNNSSTKKKCKIDCENGERPSAELNCMRNRDSGYFLKKKGDFTCEKPIICTGAEAEEEIPKQWAGVSLGDFSVVNHHSQVLYLLRKCPDSDKTSKSVSVSCKSRKGKSSWRFKGNSLSTLKGC